MNLTDFSYDLPGHLIAQYPLKKRDHSKLLIIDRKTQKFHHDIFKNIGQYLPSKSLLVLNDSKVIPARLYGRKRITGGEVEIFILKKITDDTYETMMRPMRRLQDGTIVDFVKGFWGQVIDQKKKIIRFNTKNVDRYLKRIGHMPLPPYIKRKDIAADRKDYQTVYSKNEGSVASPTAGLHFTNALLGQLKKDGHSVEKVTLHVNAATFKAVESEDITKHDMHEEEYSISKRVLGNISKAKKMNCPIVAVGTTSCRVLESYAQNKKSAGTTKIFIYPGFQFKMIDSLLTNFHQPRTTLLMLVSAFMGMELMKKAYAEAIKREYRFYSYGDGMLIL